MEEIDLEALECIIEMTERDDVCYWNNAMIQECTYKVFDEDVSVATARVYRVYNLCVSDTVNCADEISGTLLRTIQCGLSNPTLYNIYMWIYSRLWVIDSIEVKKEYQNKGIGTYILSKIKKEAVFVNAPIILHACANTKSLQSKLNSFYKKNGFVRAIEKVNPERVNPIYFYHGESVNRQNVKSDYLGIKRGNIEPLEVETVWSYE